MLLTRPQDFRSENGLYSLIQAQLDAAERRERCPNPSQESPTSTDGSDDESNSEEERASKRRRTSRDGSVEVKPEDPQQGDATSTRDDTLCLPPLRPIEQETPLRPEPRYTAAIAPGSSPPICRFNDFLRSSSPLSSLPAFMSDPFYAPSESDSSSSRRSSITDASEDAEDSFMSSTKLPRMKGKDLFDASIWADPLRTKVFYSFATTLRQKSRDCVPTSSHHFISHLKSRGKLVRCYTQNIDRIEEKVGLSTELQDGPGRRGRFSRKSTGTSSQLAKMVEEAKETPPSSQSSQPPSSQPPLLSQQSSQVDAGVECVYLHGSLEQLRCFQCKRTSSWDEMEDDTLSGLQPECPHCTAATTAREERGKRALGVGKLRPDIVLYGEDHPSAHLISPLVEHDIKLNPDILLILGTSLKVHGLKTLVREFANVIHNRNGGKVVFVNFTKPPESIWSDFIDYWVQWDCDAWVADLQARVPKLWDIPQAPRPVKEKAPPANPVAFRDTPRWTGAHWTRKIHEELSRISGSRMDWTVPRPVAVPSAEPIAGAVARLPNVADVGVAISAGSRVISEALPTPEETPESERETQFTPPDSDAGLDANNDTNAGPEAQLDLGKKSQASTAARRKSAKPRKPRKSAPAVIQQPTPQPSSSPPREQPVSSPNESSQTPQGIKDVRHHLSSILNSVKENPRVRKRKKIYGEEDASAEPTKAKARRTPLKRIVNPPEEASTLAPIVNAQHRGSSSPLDQRPKLDTLEPRSPPAGPQSTFPHTGGFRSRIQQTAMDTIKSYCSWLGPMTGFGGGMVNTTGERHQFQAGLHPAPQQTQPPRVSRVDVQRHDAREQDAATVMAEMAVPRIGPKMAPRKLGRNPKKAKMPR